MPFLRWALRLLSLVIIFFCDFGVVAIFCPLVDVVCVTRLFTAVTGFIVHPLNLSCEREG